MGTGHRSCAASEISGGVLFGIFRHQQAATATAKANQKAAEADARAEQNDAALAQANQAGA